MKLFYLYIGNSYTGKLYIETAPGKLRYEQSRTEINFNI